jgi:predicted Fe-S protein YdhL (DUF1289 family)
MIEEDGDVKSPCRKKCSLDRNRICPECCRSIDEIAAWRDADNATKRRILEAANLRRNRIRPKSADSND